MKFCTFLSMLFLATVLSVTAFSAPLAVGENPPFAPVCDLSAPNNLTITRPSVNRITISWNAVPSCSQFNLVANNQGNTTAAAQIFKDIEVVTTEQTALKAANKGGNNLIVAPNPFSTTLILNYELMENTTVSIHLLDMTGKIVQAINLEEMTGSHNKTIDASRLPKGIYFLHFDDGTKKSVQKLVKLQ